MSPDFYDSHYGRSEAEVYRAVREQAFGEDFGQTSWITAAELDAFCDGLALREGERVLEVACGSGGTAARIAERRGVSVVGVDVNDAAITAATARAATHASRERLQFRVADANDPLPFADASFDAIFCNDAINHLRDRGRVLAEWRRVLRAGGRILFTDPIVVTGPLTNAEIAARSAIGFFVFTPAGANETALAAAGFTVSRVEDVTAGVAATSLAWSNARATWSEALRALEGEKAFADTQRFLEIVHTLARERRLSRFAFAARKGQ